MTFNHKLILELSLLTLIGLGLTACGGGGSDGGGSSSSSGSGDDNGSGGSDGSGDDLTAGDNSGSNNCVTIPRQKVGDKTTIRYIVTRDGNSLETDVTTENIAVSNTSITYKSTVDLGLDINLPGVELPEGFEIPGLGAGQESTAVQTFTISNNFKHITKDVTTQGLIETTVTYTPSLNVPVDRVCEDQTWVQDYTSISSIKGSTLPPSTDKVTVNNRIEAINVSRSAPVGTFNTVQLRASSKDNDGKEFSVTSWIDIDSGVLVSMETRSDGDLIGTASLISKK